MSLMGTLAKVAIGIAVAKGAQAVLKGKSASGSTSGKGGGFGDILEQLGGGGSSGKGGQGSAIEDILGQLTGRASGGQTGGQASSQGGALGEIFKEFTKNAGGSDSGLDGMFDEFDRETESQSRSGSGNGGNFGEVFDDSLRQHGEPKLKPTPQQEAIAALMLRASIQAAKSDGRLDDDERERLVKALGDISPAERRFVENEMQQPVDAQKLARQVPRGLEPQLYAMSVMAIDLDQQSEARYLHELASAMGLDHDRVNAIHDKLDAPRIYS